MNSVLLWIRRLTRKEYLLGLAGVIIVGVLFQMAPAALTDSPENHPPSLSPIQDRIAAAGFRLEICIEATDLDEDLLLYEATNLPAGAILDSSRPSIIWLQPAVGLYANINVTVTDGQTTDTKSFNIEVRQMPDTIKPPDEEELNINLVYYGQHTPTIDNRILNINPEYFIGNTPHGLWGELSGPEIFPNINSYKEAGIKVIGYITAGYEGFGSAGAIPSQWYSLETNLRLIKNMAENDGVTGIFIDECSSFPDAASKKYLQALTDLAHSYGLITWGNVGVADFDSWYFTNGGFDLMHANENWKGQDLTQVQLDWGYRISVTGHYENLTPQEAYTLTADAWSKGLAYCYITTAYHSLPEWFEQYAALMKNHGKMD
ncbi:MAG: hypothetical protein ACRKGH_08715 [Dehalogenimonas sp.]